MGKLTTKEAEQLKKEGLLTDDAINEMQDLGLVGRKSRGERRVMKTKTGSYVSPQLYFRGLSRNGEYSNKMTEFRTKFNDLVNEYTTTLKSKTS